MIEERVIMALFIFSKGDNFNIKNIQEGLIFQSYILSVFLCKIMIYL